MQVFNIKTHANMDSRLLFYQVRMHSLIGLLIWENFGLILSLFIFYLANDIYTTNIPMLTNYYYLVEYHNIENSIYWVLTFFFI